MIGPCVELISSTFWEFWKREKRSEPVIEPSGFLDIGRERIRKKKVSENRKRHRLFDNIMPTNYAKCYMCVWIESLKSLKK